VEADVEAAGHLWWGIIHGTRLSTGIKYCPFCAKPLPRTLEQEATP
jgi:hypothetical protein